MLIKNKGKRGRTVAQRFDDFCDKSGECWEWMGCKDKDGYGFIRVDGKNIKSHRLAYSLYCSAEIDSALHVCHKCDNPSCVNPDHLWLGTNRDNQIDSVVKNRHGGQKMTADDVRFAREKYFSGQMTQAELCRKFNISSGMMSNTINKRKWAHVD